jgi:Protein of unknown function (DUF2804)
MLTAPSAVIDESGKPRVGTYAGWVPGVTWSPAAGPLRRALQGKTWHYVGLGAPTCFAAFAIIDVGWAASAFAYVFDRERRVLAADVSVTGLPGRSARVADRAGEGATSTWHGGGLELSLSRPLGSPTWQVRAHGGGVQIEATLSTTAAPPTLCAIAEIPGGLGNCTHKTVGLAASGRIEAGGASWDLAGATGMMDHTRGILARETRWRWGMAARPGLAFNLVEGFNGPVENVAWLGERMVPLGAAHFAFDAGDPLAPWHVTGEAFDLHFTPEGKRAEDKNLFVAASRYVQAIGRYSGRVAGVEVDDLVGVTEDHAARW